MLLNAKPLGDALRNPFRRPHVTVKAVRFGASAKMSMNMYGGQLLVDRGNGIKWGLARSVIITDSEQMLAPTRQGRWLAGDYEVARIVAVSGEVHSVLVSLRSRP